MSSMLLRTVLPERRDRQTSFTHYRPFQSKPFFQSKPNQTSDRASPIDWGHVRSRSVAIRLNRTAVRSLLPQTTPIRREIPIGIACLRTRQRRFRSRTDVPAAARRNTPVAPASRGRRCCATASCDGTATRDIRSRRCSRACSRPSPRSDARAVRSCSCRGDTRRCCTGRCCPPPPRSTVRTHEAPLQSGIGAQRRFRPGDLALSVRAT